MQHCTPFISKLSLFLYISKYSIDMNCKDSWKRCIYVTSSKRIRICSHNQECLVKFNSIKEIKSDKSSKSLHYINRNRAWRVKGIVDKYNFSTSLSQFILFLVISLLKNAYKTMLLFRFGTLSVNRIEPFSPL